MICINVCNYYLLSICLSDPFSGCCQLLPHEYRFIMLIALGTQSLQSSWDMSGSNEITSSSGHFPWILLHIHSCEVCVQEWMGLTARDSSELDVSVAWAMQFPQVLREELAPV